MSKISFCAFCASWVIITERLNILHTKIQIPFPEVSDTKDERDHLINYWLNCIITSNYYQIIYLLTCKSNSVKSAKCLRSLHFKNGRILVSKNSCVNLKWSPSAPRKCNFPPASISFRPNQSLGKREFQVFKVSIWLQLKFSCVNCTFWLRINHRFNWLRVNHRFSFLQDFGTQLKDRKSVV